MTDTQQPGCFGSILKLFGIDLQRFAIGAGELPYRIRDDFLSAAELSFYRVLSTAVRDQAVVCPKVNLADVLYVVRQNENRVYHNKINRKHVDFLLCEPRTMRPVAGVELDDASHSRANRQERDQFVNKVFDAAGLPLVRFTVAAAYQPSEIAAKLEPCLSQKPAVREPSIGVSAVPQCPKCGEPMVLRTAKRGPNVGGEFYGCPNFPRCKQVARVGEG